MAINQRWQDWKAGRQQNKAGRGPIGNTARRWALCGSLPIAGLFVTVGIWRNWTTAYLVLIDLMPPADAHAGVVALLLSVGGYVIVPLVVGAGVAGFFQRSIEKQVRVDLAAVAQAGLPPARKAEPAVTASDQPTAAKTTKGAADGGSDGLPATRPENPQ